MTRNPPKTLIDAMAAESTASVVTTGFSEPICSSEPTRMMPEIAFVYDINGVCSEWLTLETT